MKIVRAMIITGMVVLFCATALGQPLNTDPAGKPLLTDERPTLNVQHSTSNGRMVSYLKTIQSPYWMLNVGRWMLDVESRMSGVNVHLSTAVALANPAPAAGQVSIPDTTQDAAGEPAAMTDIHDIKSLVSVPVPVSLAMVLLWAAVCLLVAVGALGAWFLWKRRRTPPVETLEAELSPEETALRKLAALSPDAMEGKAFYFLLSAIFREYLHGRFGIDGLEMTTEELLPRVESMHVERDLKGAVKAFLVSCDPVKFAGAPTRREAMEKDQGFVRGFVEKTMAPPPASETDGEAAPQDVSE